MAPSTKNHTLELFKDLPLDFQRAAKLASKLLSITPPNLSIPCVPFPVIL